MGPQLEDGFTRIANELLEGLARLRLPGEAMQIFLVIMRQTYGYRRKEDAISISQFVEKTGMSRQSAQRGISRLLAQNVIRKKAEGLIPSYEINKVFQEWQLSAKKRRGPQKSGGGIRKKAEGTIRNFADHKRKKESLKKVVVGVWSFSDYRQFHQAELGPVISPLMLTDMKLLFETYDEEAIKEMYRKSSCVEPFKRWNYVWGIHKRGGVKKEASIWDMELSDD